MCLTIVYNEYLYFQLISKPSQPFKCHLCEIKRSSPQMLLWHLAWQHFKEDILTRNHLDASSRMCPICDKSFAHLQNLIIHLAQGHNKLQGLVNCKVLMELKKAIRVFYFKREVTSRFSSTKF